MAKTIGPRKSTYMGRRAEVTEIREAGPHGVREIRVRWIDDAHEKNGGHKAGTVVSRTVTGNFMRGTGVVLVEDHIVSEEDK